MLDINKITYITSMDAAHRQKRLGRITASVVGKLISDKSHLGVFSKGAITYLDHLATERITGKSAREEFSSKSTDYGNANEPYAIKKFCSTMGMEILVDTNNNDTHRLINYNEYIACTPDSLVCLAPLDKLFDTTGKYIKVAPLETKCPPVHFGKYYKCITPADLKKTDKLYYWQMIHQMYCCDSLIGYWSAYHPEWNGKEAIRIIEFKKIEVREDFRHLHLTLQHAQQRIIETVELFKAA